MSKAKLLAIAGAFGTLIPIITFFNVPFPIPAWAADVEELKITHEQRINKLEVKQLEKFVDLWGEQIKQQKSIHRKLKNEIHYLEKDGEVVPDHMLEEEVHIEEEIQNRQRELEEAHERIIQLESF